MKDFAALPLDLLAGILLGAFFFGGLWWTVQRGLSSPRPALWFVGSTLLRTAVIVAVWYFIAQGDWRKMALCLIGFFVARIGITGLIKRGANAS